MQQPSRYRFYFGWGGLLLPLGIGLPLVLLSAPGASPDDLALRVLGVEIVAVLLCAVGASLGSTLDERHRKRHAIVDDAERAKRARFWTWLFAIMIPVGDLGPCLSA